MFYMEDRVFDAVVVRVTPKAKSIDVHVSALDRGKQKCILELKLADVVLYIRKITTRATTPEIIIVEQRDIERTVLKSLRIKETI
jgi:hypothetical protein